MPILFETSRIVVITLLLATLSVPLAAGQQPPRSAAPRAPANVADPGAIESLIGALRHTDPDVSAAAATALARFHGPRVTYALLLALGDPRPVVAFEAASALNALHEREPDSRMPAAFLDGLMSGNVHVVAGAYRFFIRRGGTDGEQALLRALEVHGSATMARDLLDCGNARLAAAARQWATRRGQSAERLPSGKGAVRWGSH